MTLSPWYPDCLVLLVYKDKTDKTQGHKERASLTLEDICGLEVSAQGLEGAPYTLAVVCLSQAAVLGFDSKDTLLAWEIRIRYSLGEGERGGGEFDDSQPKGLGIVSPTVASPTVCLEKDA